MRADSSDNPDAHLPLTVQAHMGAARLHALQPDWRRLTQADERYWMSFDWLAECLKHAFRQEEDLRILSVTDRSGELIAIVPLVRIVEPIRRFPVAHWMLVGSRWWGDVTGTASGADFACLHRSLAPAVLQAVLDHLRGTPPATALLLVGRVAADSHAYAAAMACLDRTGLHRARDGWSWICTQPTWSEVEATLSDRFKRSLRTARRRAAEHAPVTVTVTRSSDPGYPAAYAEFLRIEASGWKGTTGTNTSLASNPVPTQREFLEALASHSDSLRVEVTLLRYGDTAVAGQLSLRHQRTLAIIKVAHDERFHAFQPGHALLAQVLEQCCADEAVTSVNLVTRMRWHEQWRTHVGTHHYFHLPISRLFSVVPLALLRLPTARQLRQVLRAGRRKHTLATR